MKNTSEFNFERTASERTFDTAATEERASLKRWTSALSRPFPLTLFAGLLLALSATLLFFMSLNRFFDHDEFEAMHTTWKMFQGQQIYVDFIQHHHPFIYYTLLPLYWIFGSTTDVLIAARVFVYFQLVGMLTLVYFIGFEIYHQARNRYLIALTGTLFVSLITLFTSKVIEVRPDVPQSLLSLLGLYLMVRFFRTRSFWLLIASGATFGVSILFLQKGIIFAGLAGLVLLGRWLFGRDIKFMQGLIFAGSAIGAMLPYVGYLLARGELGMFYFWNFTYNTVYYDLRGWEASKLEDNFNRLYDENVIILLCFAVTFLLFKKTRLEWELIFLGAAVLAFTMVTGRHNPQYYILAFPPLCILAARGLIQGLEGRKAAAALVLAFAAFMPLVSHLRNATVFTNDERLAKIQYVMDLTEPDERVYDGNIMFNLFRRDVDFIWYMAGEPYKAAETLEILMDYDYNIYEAIERYEPKVISNFGIDNMNDPRIAEHYARSPKYDDLFIRME